MKKLELHKNKDPAKMKNPKKVISRGRDKRLMYSVEKMVVEWKGSLRLEAKNEKRLSAKFDAPIAYGGEETALSPIENVLGSLAACSSFYVLTILRKKRQSARFAAKTNGVMSNG